MQKNLPVLLCPAQKAMAIIIKIFRLQKYNYLKKVFRTGLSERKKNKSPLLNGITSMLPVLVGKGKTKWPSKTSPCPGACLALTG
jgi:hypothetical protein